MSTTIKIPDKIMTCTLSDIKVGECFKLSKDDPSIYLRLESNEMTKDEILVAFDLYHNRNCLLCLMENNVPVTCIPLDIIMSFSYKDKVVIGG